MVRASPLRARWLARNVIPIETALRAWLSRYRIVGLDTDDIVQETYAILCALESVDHIHNPRQYTFQTAYSVILRHVRRAKLVSIQTLDDLDRLHIALPEASPEQRAIDRDALQELAHFIATLPRKAQQVFILRRVEGLSLRQIAEKLQISESTVEKHITRALRLISERFRNGGNWSGEASLSKTLEERGEYGSTQGKPWRSKPRN